jgi:hypothetical protein
MNQKDMSAKLESMAREEIEDYAEIIFFCVVSLTEKLEEAKKCGKGISFTGRQALALMTIRPGLFLEASRASEKGKSPTYRGQVPIEKLLQATISGKVVILDPKEAIDFLEICQHILRPKPKPKAQDTCTTPKTSAGASKAKPLSSSKFPEEEESIEACLRGIAKENHGEYLQFAS